MKGLEKLILIAVFVVPIVICVIVLRNIWKDDDENNDSINKNSGDNIISVSGTVYQSGDDIYSGDEIIYSASGETMTMGGETFESKIGDPVSKIYTDASISSVVANVYLEASETSQVVGTVSKYTVVTAQQFPQGWSRVAGLDTNGLSISGWIKTSNVSYPDGTTLSTNKSTGVVTAEPYLNVRLNPSTNATVVTTINKGETITIEESSNGWHKVTVNGVTGWVSAAYVK